MDNIRSIAVDMDCVMADIYMELARYEERKTGKLPDLPSLRGIPIRKAFPHCNECLHLAGFYLNAPVMAGAVECLKYLNAKYRVLVVSAATEYPASMPEKMAWLEKHFPFLGWKQVVFCGVKDMIAADIMIDDRIDHLEHFLGKTRILFAQPHNLYDAKNGVLRLDWKGIAEYL